MAILAIFIILIVVIIFFSSPKLSPIPYFPSQSVDLEKIIKALDLKNNQTIFDLGAGDGKIIFSSAQKAVKQNLNTKFVAVEINPVLLLILHLRRIFHPNRKNIKIVCGDIFKINLNIVLDSRLCLRRQVQGNDIVFYLYISPWFLERIIRNLKLKIKNFSIVSYMYPIKSLKKNEKVIEGKNRIFVYN